MKSTRILASAGISAGVFNSAGLAASAIGATKLGLLLYGLGGSVMFVANIIALRWAQIGN